MDFLIKVYKWLEKLIQPFREWIFKNHGNPLLWLGVFIVGILIFWYTYDSLRKEK